MAARKGEPIARIRVRAGLLVNKKAQATLAAFTIAFYQVLNIARLFGRYAWVLLPLFAVVLVNLLWPTTITVGADGILVASLVRRRFHSFAGVTGVRTSPWGIVLERKEGKEIEVRTEGRENTKGSKNRDRLLASVRRALDELTGREGAAATTLLARGGRSVDEWLRALRSLGGGEAQGYRAASIPTEELWRIALDPTAEVSARAGAAVALRGSLDDEGRERLRVAAEESASPKVRVALEAAGASKSEAELTQALEECEAEAPASEKAGVIV